MTTPNNTPPSETPTGSTFDVNDVYYLGNAWSHFGDTLESEYNSMVEAVNSVQWTGEGGDAFRSAWFQICFVAMEPLFDMSYAIGEAINAYGTAAQKVVNSELKDIEVSGLLNVFGSLLAIPSVILTVGLGEMLGGWIAELMGSFGAAPSSLSVTVPQALGGAVLGSAITLGTDAVANGLADITENVPFADTWNWKYEGIGLGVGAGIGILQSGIEGFFGDDAGGGDSDTLASIDKGVPDPDADAPLINTSDVSVPDSSSSDDPPVTTLGDDKPNSSVTTLNGLSDDDSDTLTLVGDRDGGGGYQGDSVSQTTGGKLDIADASGIGGSGKSASITDDITGNTGNTVVLDARDNVTRSTTHTTDDSTAADVSVTTAPHDSTTSTSGTPADDSAPSAASNLASSDTTHTAADGSTSSTGTGDSTGADVSATAAPHDSTTSTSGDTAGDGGPTNDAAAAVLPHENSAVNASGGPADDGASGAASNPASDGAANGAASSHAASDDSVTNTIETTPIGAHTNPGDNTQGTRGRPSDDTAPGNKPDASADDSAPSTPVRGAGDGDAPDASSPTPFSGKGDRVDKGAAPRSSAPGDEDERDKIGEVVAVRVGKLKAEAGTGDAGATDTGTGTGKSTAPAATKMPASGRRGIRGIGDDGEDGPSGPAPFSGKGDRVGEGAAPSGSPRDKIGKSKIAGAAEDRLKTPDTETSTSDPESQGVVGRPGKSSVNPTRAGRGFTSPARLSDSTHETGTDDARPNGGGAQSLSDRGTSYGGAPQRGPSSGSQTMVENPRPEHSDDAPTEPGTPNPHEGSEPPADQDPGTPGIAQHTPGPDRHTTTDSHTPDPGKGNHPPVKVSSVPSHLVTASQGGHTAVEEPHTGQPDAPTGSHVSGTGEENAPHADHNGGNPGVSEHPPTSDGRADADGHTDADSDVVVGYDPDVGSLKDFDGRAGSGEGKSLADTNAPPVLRLRPPVLRLRDPYTPPRERVENAPPVMASPHARFASTPHSVTEPPRQGAPGIPVGVDKETLSAVYPHVGPDQLPTRVNGSMLPQAEGAAVIGGAYSPEHGTLSLDGKSLNPVATAEWIRRWTSWTPESAEPVIIIAGGAAQAMPDGKPTFAAQVASHLAAYTSDGATVSVIASAGPVLESSAGAFFAGSPDADPGQWAASRSGDGWVLTDSKGTETVLHPGLATAAANLGIALVPPRLRPVEPSLWTERPERAGAAHSVGAPRLHASQLLLEQMINRPKEAAHPAAGDPQDNFSQLPQVEGAVVIGGTYSPGNGMLKIGEQLLSAAGTATWIRLWTAWTPESAQPVIIIADGAARPGTDGKPTFAAQVAAHLGAHVPEPDKVSVIAAPGSILAAPNGAFIAGGADTEPGHWVPARKGEGWIRTDSDGSTTVLHPGLATAAAESGITLVPLRRRPPTPSLASEQPQPPQPLTGAALNDMIALVGSILRGSELASMRTHPARANGKATRENVQRAWMRLPAEIRRRNQHAIAWAITGIIVTGAPFAMPGGATGFEYETGYEVLLERSDSPWRIGDELARSRTQNISLVIDYWHVDGRPAYIIELVSKPTRALEAENNRSDRPEPGVVYAEAEDIVRRLDQVNGRARLKDVLPKFIFQPLGEEAIVSGQKLGEGYFFQFTSGIPVNGLHSFLKVTAGRTRGLSQRILDSSLLFGDQVAANFAGIDITRENLKRVLDGLYSEEIVALRGAAALAYNQVSARALKEIHDQKTAGRPTVTKTYTSVASRINLADIRRELPETVRDYLHSETDGIRSIFRSIFASDLSAVQYAGDPLDIQFGYEDTGFYLVGDYLDSFLASNPKSPVDQRVGLGMSRTYNMDDGNGLQRSLVLLELRGEPHFGTLSLAEKRQRELDIAQRRAYAQSVEMRHLSVQSAAGDGAANGRVGFALGPSADTVNLERLEHAASHVASTAARWRAVVGGSVLVQSEWTADSGPDGSLKAGALAGGLRGFLANKIQLGQLPPEAEPTVGTRKAGSGSAPTTFLAGPVRLRTLPWLALDFAKGSHTESGHTPSLRRLAAYLSREASRGQRLRVVVEGGGNGTLLGSSAAETGRTRAEGVAGRLRAELADWLQVELGRLGTPIEIVVQSRGNRPSELPVLGDSLNSRQRRSAVIWVEDQGLGSQLQALKAAVNLELSGPALASAGRHAGYREVIKAYRTLSSAQREESLKHVAARVAQTIVTGAPATIRGGSATELFTTPTEPDTTYLDWPRPSGSHLSGSLAQPAIPSAGFGPPAVTAEPPSPPQAVSEPAVTVPRATISKRALRELVDGQELDLLATEIISPDSGIAARLKGRITALARPIANAFQSDLDGAPAGSDVTVTLTAGGPDTMVAFILGSDIARQLNHQIVLETPGMPAVRLCPPELPRFGSFHNHFARRNAWHHQVLA